MRNVLNRKQAAQWISGSCTASKTRLRLAKAAAKAAAAKTAAARILKRSVGETVTAPRKKPATAVEEDEEHEEEEE